MNAARLVRDHREPLILGVGAGIVSGMFGVGGGVVMVPGMVLWLGLGPHRAHATSVAAIVAASAAGLGPFALSGEVDWLTAAILLVGSSIGAGVAAVMVGRMSAVWLTRGFVVLLLVTAFRMAL